MGSVLAAVRGVKNARGTEMKSAAWNAMKIRP